MYLPDTKSMALQTNYGGKQHNLLNVNNLGGCITYYVIHSKYSYTTFSDATQWHLTDLSCPCRTRLSGMLSEQSPLRLTYQGNR